MMKLVILLGVVALRCGIEVVLLDSNFGCAVFDSKELELIIFEDVIGTLVVLEIMLFWFVSFDCIFGCAVFDSTDELNSV